MFRFYMKRNQILEDSYCKQIYIIQNELQSQGWQVCTSKSSFNFRAYHFSTYAKYYNVEK